MSSRLRRVALYWLHRRSLGSQWARALAAADVGPLPASKVVRGCVELSGLGLTLERPGPIEVSVCRMARQCAMLRTRAGAGYRIEDGRVHVQLDGLSGFAWNAADLGVWSEVFGEELYRHEGAAPDLVIDIGANIGLASLYFAKKYGVTVHAYELVPSTAQLAQKNVDANAELATLVRINSFGLSDRDSSVTVRVDPEYRPSNSLFELDARSAPGTEIAEVKPASVGLGDVLGTSTHAMLKLDAEGAEYEILDDLALTGLLKSVAWIHLEWHEREGRNPETLRRLLRAEGYQFFERRHESAPVGYISAYRPG